MATEPVARPRSRWLHSTGNCNRERPSAWRRVAATGADYAMVVPWLAVLGAVGAFLRWAEVLPGVPDTWKGRLVAQALIMLVLTVPVTLWLAWWEAARHATPGKRVFGLRVVGNDDDGERGPSFRRAVLRSAVKVTLPWELGHAALWQTWDRQVTGLPLALLVLVYVVVGMQVLLLFRGGRPLHDRLAHTVVRSV